MSSMRRYQQPSDTSYNWSKYNPVLLLGEIGYETDTGKFKIGNGHSTWEDIEYFSSGEAVAGITVDTEKQSIVSDLLNSSCNNGSIVIGSNSNAGYTSIVLGSNSNAQSGAIAVGLDINAGYSSIILGSNSNADGSSISIGTYSNAVSSSIAIGGSSVGNGSSIALGLGANGGSGSVALGMSVKSQLGSIAIGSSANSGYSSIAIGTYTNSNGSSIAIGQYINAASNNQTVIGRYNVIDTENKYAYIFADGNSGSNRKNLHTIDHNGNAHFLGKVSVDSNVSILDDGDEYVLVTKKFVQEYVNNAIQNAIGNIMNGDNVAY